MTYVYVCKYVIALPIQNVKKFHDFRIRFIKVKYK